MTLIISDRCLSLKLLIFKLICQCVTPNVYKYVGPQRKIDGVDIEPGTLVYLDPHSKNKNRYFLKVRLLHSINQGWQKVVEISRDALQAVEKAVNEGLDAVEGHQGNLLDGLS